MRSYRVGRICGYVGMLVQNKFILANSTHNEDYFSNSGLLETSFFHLKAIKYRGGYEYPM
jgi:hypothetical protein